MAGVYAADGSYNISVVNGLTQTGLMAANGSYNCVVSDGLSYKGTYHPCGAWWVTATPAGQKPIKAPDGSLNVSVSPYTTTGQRVTVVAGSL